ncbi:CheR family methyltransferase [Rhodococcus sp. MTM3W5.2]|uniref:CheR family methyltransferase n=1 Tax=Rhodococcus sp. MTM3W5.2 TaxID=1805827 RepID=UPI00097BAA12|nr:CheR family methyltransferase [Rhodococcus sp. MTM3W5.2]
MVIVANCWRFFTSDEQHRLLRAIHGALPRDGRLVIGPADLYSQHLRDHRPPTLETYFSPAGYELIFQPKEAI